jgi:hypothetical protein
LLTSGFVGEPIEDLVEVSTDSFYQAVRMAWLIQWLVRLGISREPDLYSFHGSLLGPSALLVFAVAVRRG